MAIFSKYLLYRLHKFGFFSYKYSKTFIYLFIQSLYELVILELESFSCLYLLPRVYTMCLVSLHDILHLCYVCVRGCTRMCVYSLHSSRPLSVSKPIHWAFQCTGGDRLAPNESIWDCLGEAGASVCMCMVMCVFSPESWCLQYILMFSLCAHSVLNPALCVKEQPTL